MKTKSVKKSLNTLTMLTPKQMAKISGGDSGEVTVKDFIKY